MTNDYEIDRETWIQVMRDDYLDGYIPDGGASVKVAVAPSGDLPKIRKALETFAHGHGYAFAQADSATCRLHAMHDLYHELARQIRWEDVAARFMTRQLRRGSLKPASDGRLTVDALADANDEAKQAIRERLDAIVANTVAKDYTLGREFRAAAVALCRGLYDFANDAQLQRSAAVDWLRGDGTPRLPVLRKIGIVKGIASGNARQILHSTTSWLHQAGFSGLVLALDASRYWLGKDAPGRGHQYSKATALDMNEVVRQFIDSVDDLTATFVVFLANERFLDSKDRGLRSYEALRLRLTDEVRDRHHASPFAPMVRLRFA